MPAHSVRDSSFADFIRTVERDDLLLYVTAAVGIFMPGCVYMFYQYAHKLYSEYVEKRKLRKREEELENKVVTIFYAEGRENVGELAHQIGTRLDYGGIPVVNLANIETTTFLKYKGIGLFLMDCAFDGREPESIEWFMEFLEDLAFDQKSINLPCRQMHFAVLGIGDPRSSHRRYNRAARALTRRLNSIGAVALYPLCYISSHSNTGLEKQAAAWASRIARALDKHTARFTKCSRFWYYGSDSDSSSNKSETDDDGQEFPPSYVREKFEQVKNDALKTEAKRNEWSAKVTRHFIKSLLVRLPSIPLTNEPVYSHGALHAHRHEQEVQWLRGTEIRESDGEERCRRVDLEDVACTPLHCFSCSLSLQSLSPFARELPRRPCHLQCYGLS
uniref:Flavodoxin-like domain-containing protein n=1 Tax=Setaria digitata TaxID=48799 RepID=A0A915Q3F5_9BILA